MYAYVLQRVKSLKSRIRSLRDDIMIEKEMIRAWDRQDAIYNREQRQQSIERMKVRLRRSRRRMRALGKLKEFIEEQLGMLEPHCTEAQVLEYWPKWLSTSLAILDRPKQERKSVNA